MRLLKKLLTKEDYKKVLLIKKYARIRFKRFWNEWGLSKEDCLNLLSCMAMFGMLGALYIVGCMF